MYKKNKFGFTLVELLAVIVIIGLIIIIAVPKIMKTLNNSKKRTFELTAKVIIKAAEEKNLENEAYGLEEEITCESVSNITSSDFSSCEIEFDDKGTASVTIVGKGRYKGIYVCDGTKIDVIAQTEECSLTGNENSVSNYITELLEKEETEHNGLIQTSAEYNDTTYDAGIRYVGEMSDVKNKVYYNCDDTDIAGVAYGEENYDYDSSCEVWRIIGVFDVSDGTKTEKRVKIINISSTFKTSWDSSKYVSDTEHINLGYGVNQWGESTYEAGSLYEGADLMRLLNGYYIGKVGAECTYCNAWQQESCSNICSLESLKSANMKVLTNTAKGMVDVAVWDTYGVKSSEDGVIDSSFASIAYLEEKGISAQYNGKICALENGCNDKINRTTRWTGLVGLMSVSDIMYANGWLYNQEGSDLYPWSISPLAHSRSSYVVWFAIPDNSYYDVAYAQYGVYPTVYLKSNIEIIGGDGYTKPYILK